MHGFHARVTQGLCKDVSLAGSSSNSLRARDVISADNVRTDDLEFLIIGSCLLLEEMVKKPIKLNPKLRSKTRTFCCGLRAPVHIQLSADRIVAETAFPLSVLWSNILSYFY